MRLDAPISRRFVELSADVNGPTLVRIWDAPNSTYAQRFRHSIEPFAQVLYRTAIDNYNAIPKLESTDNIVGSATSYTYGMNTRFYAKRTVDGPRAIPREVISATIQQTYNTDARSILSDAEQRSRTTSCRRRISRRCRCSCARRRSTASTGTFRTDFDGRYSRFRSFSADAGWEDERVSLISAAGATCASARTTAARTPRARPTISTRTRTCGFSRIATASRTRCNWDVKNQSLMQHRIAGYYNAQCCGFSAEYQFIDLSRYNSGGVQQDSRFHFSVTLGGIGNVSNIFGALGGANTSR